MMITVSYIAIQMDVERKIQTYAGSVIGGANVLLLLYYEAIPY